LAGVVVGIAIVVLDGLRVHLVEGKVGDPSDPLIGIRLEEPIGYPNAVGIMAVLGMLFAAALGLRARRAGAVAAGAALVPLASALTFTFSRGALVALATGLTLLVFLEWERGRALAGLVVFAAAPAVAAALCVRSPLTDAGTTLAAADVAGDRLVWQLALLTGAGAASGAIVRWAARALAPYAVAAAAAGALVAVAVVLVAGPRSLADRALNSVRVQPVLTGPDVPGRVLSLSSSGRTAYWEVAGRMVRQEPLLGEGAGSYERWWLQERPIASHARDAHNLYLETLAELGPVGLGLLVLALATPLLALRRRVRHPATAAAGAAYAAFLVHAGLDWDWEIPSVTLVGLAAGISLLVLPRAQGSARTWTTPQRVATLVAVALICVVALVAHVGNRAAAASEDALVQDDVERAMQEARRAQTWQPWAATPDRLLGEAALASHLDVTAVRSLRQAVRRDPDSWRAWFDLAVVSTGRERAEALRRTAALNPLSPELEDLRREFAESQTDS
jgi:O-antigen ligase